MKKVYPLTPVYNIKNHKNNMKFFGTSQIRLLDQYTIVEEPITSSDFMERAALALFKSYILTFDYKKPILVIAGPGNNGGDALALVTKLLNIELDVKVLLLHTGKLSADCEEKLILLKDKHAENIFEIENHFCAPLISADTIIIDGLFGSGLTRPLQGIYADAVNWMNSTGNTIISIDIPSGLQGEENDDLTVPIVKANHTLSLQFPKLAFLLPDSGMFAGEWQILDIGIHPIGIADTESRFQYLEKAEVSQIIAPRPKFSNKGTFGHLLLLAGSRDMAGAAVLSGKAALRSGVGLVSIHSAECNRVIVQTAIPEAIFHSDKSMDSITEFPDLNNYSAVAIGPGIGQKAETAEALEQLLSQIQKPCVIDADALNLVSENKNLFDKIPVNSILTPHPKEFERMFGKTDSHYKRMLLAREKAQQLRMIIVLKGAHTMIAMPDGQLIFNSTGNPGMATAGTGDVLTGILGGLLAQGYTPENAAILGVYLHGFAGDLALETTSEQSLLAGDVIESMGKAYKKLSPALF